MQTCWKFCKEKSDTQMQELEKVLIMNAESNAQVDIFLSHKKWIYFHIISYLKSHYMKFINYNILSDKGDNLQLFYNISCAGEI